MTAVVDPAPPDTDAIVRAAVSDLAPRVDADRDRVEQAVRKHVDELFEHARVKTFVGVLAQRRALVELRAPDAPSLSA